MLREIELKVLGRHYENVLQRASKRRKGSGRHDGFRRQCQGAPERACRGAPGTRAVLRRYAEQLKDEITASR
jgi:hypothetical protein